jgi:hypothetical protein
MRRVRTGTPCDGGDIEDGVSIYWYTTRRRRYIGCGECVPVHYQTEEVHRMWQVCTGTL